MKNLVLALILFFTIEVQAKEKIKPLVYVICSPKCGSQTLTESFKNAGFETEFSHNIRPEVRLKILEQAEKQPILLIDSTRDIIAKKISDFFQHFVIDLVGMDMNQIVETYEKDKIGYLNFLMSEFNRMIHVMAEPHSPEFWKDLDCDYLAEGSFNFKKKYQLIQHGNLYFMNLRFDDIDQWESIIKSLPIPFNLKNFKICTTNQTQDKIYKDLYVDFLKNVRMSRIDFNEIVSKNMNHIEHFYKKKEIKDFIDRWQPFLID